MGECIDFLMLDFEYVGLVSYIEYCLYLLNDTIGRISFSQFVILIFILFFKIAVWYSLRETYFVFICSYRLLVPLFLFTKKIDCASDILSMEVVVISMEEILVASMRID